MDPNDTSKRFPESPNSESYSEEDLNNGIILSASEEILSISDNEVFFDTLEFGELTDDTSFLSLPQTRIPNNPEVCHTNESLQNAHISVPTAITSSRAIEKGSAQDWEVIKNIPLKEVLKNLLEKYFGKPPKSTSESRTDCVEKSKTQDSPGELWKRTSPNKYFVEITNSTVESKTDTRKDNSSFTSYSSEDSFCIKSDFDLEINNNHPSLEMVKIHDEIFTISDSDQYLSTIDESSREYASNSWINYSFSSANAYSNYKEISSSESDSTSSFQSASNIDVTDFSVDIEESWQTFSPSWSPFAPLDGKDQHWQALNNFCNRSREKDATSKEKGKYKRSSSLPRECSPAELNFLKTNDHSDVEDSSRLLIPQQRIRRSSSCIIMSPIKPVKQLTDHYMQLEKESKREQIILETMIRRRRPPVPFITITNATPR